ncbi:MAG: radical SAM protein [Spirochaetia bacterium]|nr:radical SAM protein [Spirochaetia bacterium]MBR5928016.1 radical SAM protein [Spirochaetia bacterium]
MRVSTYEIFLPLINGKEEEIKDRTLLINGLYGAMDILKKEDADKVKAGDFQSLPLSLRERLLLRGHLTCKDKEAELADQKLLGRIYRTVISRSGIGPVIMPTYDCNFRCPYCFEQHRLCKGQEWLNQNMTPEMIDTIFKALKDYKDRGYKVSDCSLYGGEPLLAKNLETVRSICQHCKELGLELSAITNGYELEAFLDLLEEFKFKSLQITVDGVGTVNDKLRIHKSGCGTYEKILKNIKLATQRGIKVNMRVNISRGNLHGIKDLVDDLKARGFEENEKYSYYFKAVNDDKCPENNVREHEIIDELMRIGFTAQEAIMHQSQYSVPANGMKELLKKEGYPEFNPGYCGSEGGMMVIDPFGRVYPCWDIVAKDDTVVGYADKDTGRFIFGFEKAKWRTRTTDIMETCQCCPYTFTCRGGCASRAFADHGSFFHEYCGESKEIINYVASRIAGKAWEENHCEELTLSLAGPVSRITEADRKTIMETRSQKEILNIMESTGFTLKKESN